MNFFFVGGKLGQSGGYESDEDQIAWYCDNQLGATAGAYVAEEGEVCQPCIPCDSDSDDDEEIEDDEGAGGFYHEITGAAAARSGVDNAMSVCDGIHNNNGSGSGSATSTAKHGKGHATQGSSSSNANPFGFGPVKRPPPSMQPFDVGTRLNPLQFCIDKSPMELLWMYFSKVFHHVLKCTNQNIAACNEKGGVQVELVNLDEFYYVHAIMMFTTVVRLSHMVMYWEKKVYCGMTLPNFNDFITYDRYKSIRHFLRLEMVATYLQNDNNSVVEDSAWKVRKVTTMVKTTFQQHFRHAGQHISVDEAMIKYYGKRCPIGRAMPRKPIKHGIKLFVMVDYATGLMLDFNVDDNEFTAAKWKESWAMVGKQQPYGVNQHQVVRLVDDNLVGHGGEYIIYTDNFYTTVPLARALFQRNCRLIGTWKRTFGVPPGLQFGGLHAKPSKANPRGKCNALSTADQLVHGMGYMDSGAMYMIDTVYGCDKMGVMKRHDTGGEMQTQPAPRAIIEYNNYMGGVDRFDHIHNGFYGVETGRRTIKWTLRFYEAMLSICVSQAFIAHRSANKGTKLEQSHNEFCGEIANALFARTIPDDPIAAGTRSAAASAAAHIEPKGHYSIVSDIRRVCNWCPNSILMPDGKRTKVYRAVQRMCAGCGVHLHDKCFKDYHDYYNPHWDDGKKYFF